MIHPRRVVCMKVGDTGIGRAHDIRVVPKPLQSSVPDVAIDQRRVPRRSSVAACARRRPTRQASSTRPRGGRAQCIQETVAR